MSNSKHFNCISGKNIDLSTTTVSNSDLEFSTTDLHVTIKSGRTVSGTWRCSEWFHAYMLNTFSKEIDKYVTNSTSKYGR